MRPNFSPPPHSFSIPHKVLLFLIGGLFSTQPFCESVKFSRSGNDVIFRPPAAYTGYIRLYGSIDAQEFTAESSLPPGGFGSFTPVEELSYEAIGSDWFAYIIREGWPDIPLTVRSQGWQVDWGTDTGKLVLIRYRADNFKRGNPPANPFGEFYTLNGQLYPWYFNSLYPGGIREAAAIFVGDQISPDTGKRIAGSVRQDNRIIFNGNPAHEIWSFEGEDTIRYSDFNGPAEIMVQAALTQCPGNPPTASFEYSLRATSACKLLPFTPLSDPNAVLVEEGQTPVLMNGLTPQLLASYQCLDQAVRAVGGTLTVNSAVRPPQYQNHLYEVRQNKLRLDTLGADTSGCQSILPEVRREWNKHRPGVTGKTSKHSLGKAIDMNWYPENIDIATLSKNCGLRRPLLNWKVMPEPWHFEN